jgi:galactokinase
VSAALRSRAAALFAQALGRAPDGTVFAPGRVNLIGEHVDYNDGLVLPMPTSEGTAVAWARRSDGAVRVIAADVGETDIFTVPERAAVPDWRSYVRGMARVSGRPGLDLVITGDLPQGAGLSSSASLCIGVGRAFAAVMEPAVDPVALARAAQATEHDYAGVACGIMDQMAVSAGQAGRAMLLDCRDLSHSLHALPADWTVLIAQSGVTRGLVDGEYNQRRAACEAAARALGVAALRDATLADLASAALPDVQLRRARHVISEIDRVRATVAALAAADLAAFGAIMRAGHASLRDDFGVSVPAVDALVDHANALLGKEGGARMTGAGFGGAIVIVAARGREAALAVALDRPLLRAW